jgi:hypothetical protein
MPSFLGLGPGALHECGRADQVGEQDGRDSHGRARKSLQ